MKYADRSAQWNFFLSGGRLANPPVTSYDLVSPGRGFGWREPYGPVDGTDHLSKPILFENDQGWKVINCTYYYAASDPARKGVRTPPTSCFVVLNVSSARLRISQSSTPPTVISGMAH